MVTKESEESMMFKGFFQEKDGITLISLVLTIIVLLILVGVSLALVVGEEGIIKRAVDTKNITETADLQEKIKVAAMAAQIDGLGNIQSIDTLKNELDSTIGTNYEIENVGDGWSIEIEDNNFYIDKKML